MIQDIAKDTLKTVAKEILLRYISAMECGQTLGDGEITEFSPEVLAQDICYRYRNDPEMSEYVEKYSELADMLTDGAFSASIQSWSATKQ